VREAIATLPWVEKDTIKTDATKKQVLFAMKNKKDFDDKAVLDALKAKGAKYAADAAKLTGPTEN
jgi:hypothetical protein